MNQQEPIKFITAAIKNKNEKFLCLWNKQRNLWTFPMGKVNGNETWYNCLIREMREELNIKVIAYNHYDNASFEFNNEPYQNRTYEVISYNGIITNKEPEKHLEMKWLSVSEINMLIKNNQVEESTKRFLLKLMAKVTSIFKSKKVIATIIKSDGKYLVLYNKFVGAWGIPTGTIKEGEQSEETLIREMYEELGITILEYELLLTDKLFWRNNSYDFTIYTVQKYSGIVANKETHKHSHLVWASIPELRKLITHHELDPLTTKLIQTRQFK